jgi:hypothetical protein
MAIFPGPGTEEHGFDRRLYRLEVLVWNLVANVDPSSLEAGSEEIFETLRAELWKQLGGGTSS